MKIQVLVATMHQDDFSLIKKMNIRTDAIVGNQCNRNKIEEFEYNGNKVLYLSFNERGVGLNRNNALMRSNADICLLADDDMIFYDDYENTVLNTFRRLRKADVIVFNIDEEGNSNRRKNYRVKRVSLFNYMNYGAARLAFRRQKLSYMSIFFNTNFGGGTKHSCGEDSLFLRSCLQAKLKIYVVPFSIAKLTNSRESSWFNGYDYRYFYDKGFFLGVAHPRLCNLFALFLIIKHTNYVKKSNFSCIQIYKILRKGIRDFKHGLYTNEKENT